MGTIAAGALLLWHVYSLLAYVPKATALGARDVQLAPHLAWVLAFDLQTVAVIDAFALEECVALQVAARPCIESAQERLELGRTPQLERLSDRLL